MLICHIGLHKTATSSIQFQMSNYSANTVFLGRNYGTFGAQSDTYRLFLDVVGAEDLASVEIEKKRLTDSLTELSANADIILISEETFTSTHSAFHKNPLSPYLKLQNLKNILDNTDIDYHILVTVRNEKQISNSFINELVASRIYKKPKKIINMAPYIEDLMLLCERNIRQLLDTYFPNKYSIISYDSACYWDDLSNLLKKNLDASIIINTKGTTKGSIIRLPRWINYLRKIKIIHNIFGKREFIRNIVFSVFKKKEYDYLALLKWISNDLDEK